MDVTINIINLAGLSAWVEVTAVYLHTYRRQIMTLRKSEKQLRMMTPLQHHSNLLWMILEVTINIRCHPVNIYFALKEPVSD